MKNFLTRYHPRYIRSLVYMLQASEYKISDYLAWFNRTKDFLHVEKRKQLEKTAKAKILLVLGWILALAILISIFTLPFSVSGVFGIVLFIFFLIDFPYLVAYAIIIPTIVIQILQKPVEQKIIQDAKKILSSHKATKIAIAGSFGKTSMREILRAVLSEGKKVAAPGASHNTPLAISQFVKKLDGSEEILIFELGEYYPGDVKKLCELVLPDYGVITGINEAHLEKFRTLERTTQTIFELADFLHDKPTFVNEESEATKNAARPHHVLYSREGVGGWRVENVKIDLSGTSFELVKGSEKIQMRSQLLGLHQVGPLSVVAEIASRLGLSKEQIEKGIAKTKPFDHRLEPKEDVNGVITLDDSYNGNPDGVNAVIDFLETLKNHRRFYVTPGLVEMGNRKEEIHKNIGRKLAKAGIENVILVKNSVTPFIELGLKEANYQGKIHWYDDALVMLQSLPHLTVKGDVVLVQNDWPDQYA